VKRQKLIRIETPTELRQDVLAAARRMRRQPTRSEALLWRALRGKQLEGVKFRRQQPIGPFVVDFYAPSCRLVVEVDGTVHEMQVEANQSRQRLLEAIGLRVLRIPAALVENDLPEAIERIRSACAQRIVELP
jgi:very-short-patch-repair endonuclease